MEENREEGKKKQAVAINVTFLSSLKTLLFRVTI